MKTNKEIVQELVAHVIEMVSNGVSGGSSFALLPVTNIIKLKMGAMTEEDAAALVDSVHQISHRIETETGKLSPYHCVTNDAAAIVKPTSIL